MHAYLSSCRWFLDKIGHKGLNQMLVGFSDKTAYAQCIFAYTPNSQSEPMTFVGRTDGRIVDARGETSFGWDPVFEPLDSDETFAEMSKERKNCISHRHRALEKLRKYIHAAGVN
jgi:inosine triphosphate pyrophosphatase